MLRHTTSQEPSFNPPRQQHTTAIGAASTENPQFHQGGHDKQPGTNATSKTPAWQSRPVKRIGGMIERPIKPVLVKPDQNIYDVLPKAAPVRNRSIHAYSNISTRTNRRRRRRRPERSNGNVRIIRRRPLVPLIDFSVPLIPVERDTAKNTDSIGQPKSHNEAKPASSAIPVPETSMVIHAKATRGR